MVDIYSPAGVDITSVPTDAEFAVGQQAQGSEGSDWIYVQASNSIAQYDAVAIKAGFKAAPLTLTNAATAVEVGFAQVAVGTKDSYLWVQKNGRPIVKVAVGVQANGVLYATATGGVLDDTSASVLVQGVVAVTEVTDSAGTTTCVARFPTLKRGAT